MEMHISIWKAGSPPYERMQRVLPAFIPLPTVPNLQTIEEGKYSEACGSPCKCSAFQRQIHLPMQVAMQD
uniref:Uncharacterized protein n=1 Tax=Anguilla anguilla TaxID=7936 RepID=A0A0E9XJ22_ANGAN